MKVCLNGKFIDEKKAKISVLDNVVLYGDGFYDTMRVYQGKILELNLHLERILHSAEVLGIKIFYTAKQLESFLKKAVVLNRLREGRVRITFTRGDNGFDFLTCKKSVMLITVEKLVVDFKIYKQGVSVSTLHIERPMPEIKMVGLTCMISAYREVLPKGAYEAILVDCNNYVREGASTNVFAIKNGIVYTPKTKILNGLTRQRVVSLLKKSRIKILEKDFKVNFLLSADEVFLTNRPRQIIPVTKFNQKKVNNGKVGQITKIVMKKYEEYIRKELSLL